MVMAGHSTHLQGMLHALQVQHSALEVPLQHCHEAFQLHNVLPCKPLLRVCDNSDVGSPELRALSRFLRKWPRMSSGQRKRRQKGRRHHLIHASSDINFLGTASGQPAFLKRTFDFMAADYCLYWYCVSASIQQGAARCCMRAVSC